MATSGAWTTRGATWAELLEVNPDFSLIQRERVMPYKNAGDFQRIVEGLTKASLP
jgi:hypothetical protein